MDDNRRNKIFHTCLKVAHDQYKYNLILYLDFSSPSSYKELKVAQIMYIDICDNFY